MNRQTLKASLISTLLVITSACSTAPTHLIVAPQVYLPASNQLADKQANITVIDMRTSPHIVQILQQDEAAIILSAEQRIEEIIKGILAQQWPKQGLLLSDSAKNNLTVTIEKAIVSVDQESVSYNTQSEIIVKVTVDNKKQTLTTRFKTRAHSEGALNADVAVLEREFNQHLANLLKQVLTSEDIKHFL